MKEVMLFGRVPIELLLQPPSHLAFTRRNVGSGKEQSMGEQRTPPLGL